MVACRYCLEEGPRCGGAWPLEWDCSCGRTRLYRYISGRVKFGEHMRMQRAHKLITERTEGRAHELLTERTEGEALVFMVNRARGA